MRVSKSKNVLLVVDDEREIKRTSTMPFAVGVNDADVNVCSLALLAVVAMSVAIPMLGFATMTICG